jgi:hypothetical protein
VLKQRTEQRSPVEFDVADIDVNLNVALGDAAMDISVGIH